MGMKTVLAGLLLPLIVPLILMAPVANSAVTKCQDGKNGEIKCRSSDNACGTFKCDKGDASDCVLVGKGKNDGGLRKFLCPLYGRHNCKDKGGVKEGPDACQICTTEMCNTGDLLDGGDWDNPDHKPSTTTPSTTPRATTTSTKSTPKGTTANGGNTEEPSDEPAGGHFAIISWLLLIVAGLLVGLISQSAVF